MASVDEVLTDILGDYGEGGPEDEIAADARPQTVSDELAPRPE